MAHTINRSPLRIVQPLPSTPTTLHCMASHGSVRNSYKTPHPVVTPAPTPNHYQRRLPDNSPASPVPETTDLSNFIEWSLVTDLPSTHPSDSPSPPLFVENSPPLQPLGNPPRPRLGNDPFAAQPPDRVRFLELYTRYFQW